MPSAPSIRRGRLQRHVVDGRGDAREVHLDDLDVLLGRPGIEELAETEALLESLGATVDDLMTASASRINEDFTEFTFVVAYRVSNVDADDLLEGILPSFNNDLEEPRPESGQVACKDVVLVWDDASPDAQPFYLYPSEDTVWLVLAMEPLLTEALDALP